MNEVMNKDKILDTGVEAMMCSALQRPAPYYAKILDDIDNGQSSWRSLRIGIFERPPLDSPAGETEENDWSREPQYSDSDPMIGEYNRNYHSLMRTFHPFQLRGRWYALYSKDYTATRLMELPSCKDIGGEGGDSWGFCPTDYWVPPLHYCESPCEPSCPRFNSPEHTPDYTKPCICKNEEYIWHFPDRIHGFVAGCIWGDDASWKCEYLDLSQADEGIIKRDDRFGYIEMPSALNLDKAIRLEAYDRGKQSLTIAVQKHFDLATGKDVSYKGDL
jgi:hypothetical protein